MSVSLLNICTITALMASTGLVVVGGVLQEVKPRGVMDPPPPKKAFKIRARREKPPIFWWGHC